MLTHFDHLTLVVRDVSAATHSYARLLGSAAHWRGEHPELGSVGSIFAFANGALELTGPRGETAESEGLRALLETRGEGLQALSFGVDDAAECTRMLRDRGVRATPPEEGEARAENGEIRRYRTVQLSPRNTRGLSIIAVERPDASALKANVSAQDCAHAIDHVVIRTADPEAAIALYGTGLGIRLALDRVVAGHRMLFFRVGGVTLEVVHDAQLGEHDQLWGVTYRVRDIEAAHRRMTAEGFLLSEVRAGMKPGTRVFTVRDAAGGVKTLMLMDPARDA